MHSFFSNDGPVFQYNSDMSGNVRINVRPDQVEHLESYNGTGPYVAVEISGEALLQFVAEHIRRQKISKIEEMTVEQLLSEQ